MDALDARSPPPSRGRIWALTSLVVVALAGAVVLAFAGIRAGGGEEAVLYVDDAVISVVPSTVPPVSAPAVPPVVASTVPLAATIGASEQERVATPALDRPVAAEHVSEQGFDRSAAARAQRPQPIGLQIETIDVSRFPVRDVGLEENGQLEVPDETEIGWYKYGATAGHPGATVLAAHVNWRGSNGPFALLGKVEPGDEVEVALNDGTTRNYVVTERTMYGKLALPRERIWRNTGPEELVLITCGGDFNSDIRSFASNIVVYAVPSGEQVTAQP